MKQRFIIKKFSPESRYILDKALEIIDRYEDQGYRLSLRQLYYQLVAANAVPNTEKSYDKVGNIIADARMAGMADWDMIEDRNRSTSTVTHWENPSQIIQAAADGYKIDKWKKQPNHVEVMVEKAALEGVLEPVCRELDIPFTANRGYSSITMMYHTGQRLKRLFIEKCEANGLIESGLDKNERMDIINFYSHLADQGITQPDGSLTSEGIKSGFPRIVVCYLGDHDPSGIDMSRDVLTRLLQFSDTTPIEVHRLALNINQVRQLNPPENPAKMTDSRAAAYVRNFGYSSWELDAVEPAAMAQMVRTSVLGLRNESIWTTTSYEEESERKVLIELSKTALGKNKNQTKQKTKRK